MPNIPGLSALRQRAIVRVLDKLISAVAADDFETARRATWLKWRLVGYDPLRVQDRGAQDRARDLAHAA